MTKDAGLAYEVHTFRTVAGVALEAHIAVPEGVGEHGPRAAMAYFHPGSWRAGSPGLFRELRYLASRGMVAAAFGYRLLPGRRRSSSPPAARWARLGAAGSILDCVADAQAAVRWLRRYAGVDGTRVVAAGYSSGAHLAAATALLPAVDRVKGSCKPNALVLHAGVFDLGRPELSPLTHVRKNGPPGLLLYGVEDRLASQGQHFAKAMTAAGNRCELVEFPGGHGTFAARPDNPVFAAALARVDEFLVSLGYLDAVTDVERRIADLDLSTPKPRRKRIAASP